MDSLKIAFSNKNEIEVLVMMSREIIAERSEALTNLSACLKKLLFFMHRTQN
jgi:hypothetical protein